MENKGMFIIGTIIFVLYMVGYLTMITKMNKLQSKENKVEKKNNKKKL